MWWWSGAGAAAAGGGGVPMMSALFHHGGGGGHQHGVGREARGDPTGGRWGRLRGGGGGEAGAGWPSSSAPGSAGRCSRGRGRGHNMSVKLSRRAGAGRGGRRAGGRRASASASASARGGGGGGGFRGANDMHDAQGANILPRAVGRCVRAVASSPVTAASLALGASAFVGDGNGGGTLGGSNRQQRPHNGSLTSGDPNRKCTDVLLWATGAGYALQILTGHAFTSLGAKVNAKIAAGQVWRLLTPTVLHGSVVHLLVNCYSLHNIGPVIERQFGREQFLAVYVGGGLGGNFLSYKMCPNNAVGASSAIFGLVGALGVYLQRHSDLFGAYGERQLQNVMGSIGANALFGMMSSRIDNWAHLGGLLAGAAVAFVAGPNLMVVDGGTEGAKRVGARGRAVVNRPLLQTYVGEFVREFRDGGGGRVKIDG